jgi:hypothetical protein
MSMRLSGDPHVTSTVLTYFDVASHCRRVLIFAVVRGVSAARLPAGITCSPLEGRERRTSRMSGLLGSKAPSPSRWWTSRTHITWPSTTNCAHVAVRNLNGLRDALPCRVPTPHPMIMRGRRPQTGRIRLTITRRAAPTRAPRRSTVAKRVSGGSLTGTRTPCQTLKGSSVSPAAMTPRLWRTGRPVPTVTCRGCGIQPHMRG